ncbi:alkyl sulfatase C-terminal domain-containing protein [Candidatus Burkholderia verschuerenii]|uniref:alkyl sulfatase C-terminal domain-containing protein n=1 Tax=Candidatus Burkholderia verschuerenii TaxID=242163 RepID=UPI0034DD237F
MSRDLVSVLPLEQLLDYFSVHLNAEKAESERMLIEWSNSDTGERIAMRLENSALTYLPGAAEGRVTATVSLSREGLARLQMGRDPLDLTFDDLVGEGYIQTTGDSPSVLRLLNMLDDFEPMFNVVEP